MTEYGNGSGRDAGNLPTQREPQNELGEPEELEKLEKLEEPAGVLQRMLEWLIDQATQARDSVAKITSPPAPGANGSRDGSRGAGRGAGPNHDAHASHANLLNQLNSAPVSFEDLYASSAFAQMWYETRQQGERDRAHALHALYTQRAHQGGAYPDPRLPAAFSDRAIIAAASKRAGVRISLTPAVEELRRAQQAQQAQSGSDHINRLARQKNAVWLITYPPQNNAGGGVATLAVASQTDEALMLWHVATMLGFIAQRAGQVMDPYAPAGVTTIPNDPVTFALCHRYARALLNLSSCYEPSGCPCEDITRALNAPPPDHTQPTMTIPAQRVRPAISQPNAPTGPAGPPGHPSDTSQRRRMDPDRMDRRGPDGDAQRS